MTKWTIPADLAAAQAEADALRARVAELEAALGWLIASHADFLLCYDKSLGWPDISWSREIENAARAALAASWEDKR